MQTSDDEVQEVEKVSKASRKDATRKGYKCTLKIFSGFLCLAFQDLLDPGLIETTQNAQKDPDPSPRLILPRQQNSYPIFCAPEIEKASPTYHPVKVENLTANHFIGLLLSSLLTETKEEQYLSRIAALNFLIIEYRVDRSEGYLSDLKQGRKGLKSIAAAGRSSNGERLTEGKAVMSFELYAALFKWFFEAEGT